MGIVDRTTHTPLGTGEKSREERMRKGGWGTGVGRKSSEKAEERMIRREGMGVKKGGDGRGREEKRPPGKASSLIFFVCFHYPVFFKKLK